jgi:hypothetical protein
MRSVIVLKRQGQIISSTRFWTGGTCVQDIEERVWSMLIVRFCGWASKSPYHEFCRIWASKLGGTVPKGTRGDTWSHRGGCVKLKQLREDYVVVR